MNKIAIFSTMIATVLIISLAQSSHQATEIVFEENFDGALIGWTESVCDRNTPATQVCRIGQATQLFDPPNEAPNSPPNWGFVEIEANGGAFIPVEVRYQKSFNVAVEDDYDVSSWLGVKDCTGLGECHIASRLFIDGVIVLEQAGPDLSDEPPLPSHVFFEQTTVHLTAGNHNVEMGMLSPEGAINGFFRASFDDILIQRTIPDPPEELTKQQQKALDKSTMALEKACTAITREITKLETIPQTIPIEIVELELRACGP